MKCVVMIWGAPAAGKTALARDLIACCSGRGQRLLHLSSDALRQAIVGAAWRPQVRGVVYEGLRAMTAQALADDLPVLLDANYLDGQRRARIREVTCGAGARLLSVLVHCDLALRLTRNRQRGEADRVPPEHIRAAHVRAEDARGEADMVVESGREAVDAIIAWIYGDDETRAAPMV